MELYSYQQMISPHWEYRNFVIANMMEPNKSVIDMGCGSKNLLKFYNPSLYVGVDGIPSADIVLDLNTNFKINGYFDYSVNSGILEFVNRPDCYLEKIKTLAAQYFFSWWRGSGWGRLKFSEVEDLLQKRYIIDEVKQFGLVNRLYKCRALSNL